MSGLSRRKFLFGLAATGGALVLRRGLPSSGQARRARSPGTSVPANRVVTWRNTRICRWLVAAIERKL